jgi:hypothetical protein
VATASNDVAEIYHQMAVIRRELHTNVRESVAGAEAFADWGRYTWTYPWIALGAAVAVGYTIYTSGHQNVTNHTASPADGPAAVEPVAEVAVNGQQPFRGSQNLLRSAWGLLSPVAVRAGQNCLLRWLEEQIPTRSADQTPHLWSAGERSGRVQRQDIKPEQRHRSKPNSCR